MHAALHGIAGLFTWPRRLRQQVLLVVLLIMVAAMVLLYRVSTHRLAEVALQSSSEWAAAVARSAASAGTEPLALQDVAGLQVVLQDIASLPGVLGIDTFDAQGHPMLALRLAPDGKRVTSHWRLPDLKPPPASAAAAHVQHVDGQRRLYAWAPIGPEGSLGLVGVTFSLEREQAHVDALRYDAVMAIGFAGLLTGVGVWLLLRRALTPLQRVVDFSRRLADQPGLQFNALGSSLEVAELTAVLNEASRRLRAQLDTIRASEDQMAAILHTVPDAIIGFGDDGLIASASPAAEELFDRPLAELVGRPLQELLPGLDADDADRRTLTGRYRALSASHVARHEIVRRLGEGREQALEVTLARTVEDGRMRYVAVVRDVTELTHARRAVAERTARLNAVFELSPDGFVLFDRDGRLAFCNRAFVQMTGWNSAASLVGMPQAEFDRRMALLGEPGAESSGWVGEGEVTTLQLRLPQPRVLARTLRRRDDAQGGTVLYFRDITHETEVDRMKSEFLTTAAHELRTPMVSVFGFTELLLNRPVPEARRRDMLETIHRQSTLLINMVNELLDLARIEARGGKDLRPCDCEVGELVRQAAAGFMVEGADRALRLELPHEQARVHVDPDKLVRALTNVLSNACKYSPDGGDVDLSTTAGRVGGRPAVGLRVTDRGIGMTPTQQARMFERFYRADPSGNIPGTGLGMCLVKEIVELHQGRVEVQSEPGRGTTVTLWLPLADAGHEARVDSAEPAAA